MMYFEWGLLRVSTCSDEEAQEHNTNYYPLHYLYLRSASLVQAHFNVLLKVGNQSRLTLLRHSSVQLHFSKSFQGCL